MLVRKFTLFAAALFLVCTSLARAQDHRDFHDGLREGGRGGHYDRDRYHHDDDRRYDDRDHRGGIGPGKGALIGAAGGAALGAIFGGGLKGTIVGGAAGAGIGAVIGDAHQNDRRRRDRYYGR